LPWCGLDWGIGSIISAMEGCIFCSIASGEIPSDIVLEDDLFVAFRDIHPKAPVHVLVVPREHITSLNQVHQWSDCQGQALLGFVAGVAEKMGVSQTGYRALVNTGPDAGQEVQHLHFHILGGENLGDVR
jgi:histidine triad (HIT) family protein